VPDQKLIGQGRLPPVQKTRRDSGDLSAQTAAHATRVEADLTMSAAAKITHDFSPWIGRTRTVQDEITAFPLNAMAGTLGWPPPDAAAGTPLPPLWHWLYFLPILRPDDTRHDGHAKGDEFMPSIPLPRRMWAGSRFIWTAGNPMKVGDRITRSSRIESITPKAGRSGQLVFVKLVHHFRNTEGVCLVNEHQVVFRGPPEVAGSDAAPARAATDAAWHRQLAPDPILLFRFSALTFNSHRVHYDRPYALGEEGYPTLLVQGPLIAILLLDLLRRHAPDAVLRSLELKAVRPSYVDRPLHLRGQPERGGVRLWAADAEGLSTMTAVAEVET
jgi:3-methylfumaryl-CoA hydratase